MHLAPTFVREATEGDQRAFVLLIEPILPAAHRLAIGMLRSESDAEDAVQDAALKAWQHFGKFRRDLELKPWLLTIVANECRHKTRSRWWTVIRRPETPEEPGAGPASLDAATMDLRRALYQLPHDQRLVLVLRFYLDLSYDEVAQTLGISSKAAKSRTYRAVQRLRMNPEVFADE